MATNSHNKQLSITPKSIFKEPQFYILIALMFIGYIILHEVIIKMLPDLTDRNLLKHNMWDSYTYQAKAWLSGKLDVENYPWLEIAQYNGKFFVSFPPLPSVVMLPFVLIFGEQTPNNLLIAIYAIITACLAYASLRKINMNAWIAAFMALFTVWGSNMLWMSTMGGVWFQAQALNMLFLMLMIYAAQCQKRMLAYAMVALAVGCRPFSVLAAIPLFIYFYEKDVKDGRVKGIFEYLVTQLKYLVIPLCIGLVYMWYNYARFDNPFEFGHNYLPEFIESPDGQFSISYLKRNIYNLFAYFPQITSSGFNFPMFNGFIFYIANPFFLVVIIKQAIDILKKRFDVISLCMMGTMILSIVFFVIEYKQNTDEATIFQTLALACVLLTGLLFIAKLVLGIFLNRSAVITRTNTEPCDGDSALMLVNKRVGLMRITLIFVMFMNILSICYHKTLGGWQFGARYTVDFLPFAFMYMLLDDEWKVKPWEYAIGIFAIAFNVYGAIMGQI